MDTLSNITVKKELRLCKVDKELGYFHCWEQYADVCNFSWFSGWFSSWGSIFTDI